MERPPEAGHDEFRSAFEHAGVGMAMTDAEDRFVRVNRRFADMLGYGMSEIVGATTDIFTADDHGGAADQRRGAFVSGASLEMGADTKLVHRDGSQVWVSVAYSLARREDGRPKYLLWVVQDVSARRAAELALRESEEKFRQLADNIPEIFWITDVRQRKLHYLSPAFETLTGKRLADVMRRPRSWLQVVHPDDRDRVRFARKSLPQAEYNIEYRIRLADGTVRWMHDQAFPVRDANGNVCGIL